MSRSIILLKPRRMSLDSSIWGNYLALTKPRLVSLVLLSTAVGFYSASGETDVFRFFATLMATLLVASGSMALNQYMEREVDQKMVRTQNRPLPAGKLEPSQALVFGLGLSLAGFISFVLFVNWVSAFFGLLTWASYLFIYTPLKAKTSLSTVIGAIPGALPPVIGWAGASGGVEFHALLLFMIIFFWQMPHFLSIAWMYREDYRRVHQPILSVVDQDGSFVARQMILYMCALMPISLLPTIFGLAGVTYFFGSFLLGICFAAVIIFSATHLNVRARYVLRASVMYLGTLLLLMTIDKV